MGASLGQPSLLAVILSDRRERRIPSWSYRGFPKDKLEILRPRCARPQNDAGGFGREIKSAPSVNHTQGGLWCYPVAGEDSGPRGRRRVPC
jgi:hypothetical protein